jgi:hypothetical protein
VYTHEVRVQAETPAGPKSFNFNGVVVRTDKELTLTGLSPMGMTLFKLHDNFREPEKLEIYIEAMKKLEPRFHEYYGVLKAVLLLDRQAPARNVIVEKRDEEGNMMQLQVRTGGSELPIELRKYDAAHVPREFSIRAAHYDIHVDVRDYKLVVPGAPTTSGESRRE